MSTAGDKKLMTDIYAVEDRSQTPKEYFKFLVAQTKAKLPEASKIRIADIGCAGGDFLHYLDICFPEASLTGIDISPELLEVTKRKVPSATTKLANIASTDFKPDTKYDVIYFAGVILMLDSYAEWVANIAASIAEGGAAFLFCFFNPYPYDVMVKAKSVQTGESFTWNCYSRESIIAEFNKHGCKADFIHWDVPLDIPQNEQNLLRTWTTPMQDGTRMTTNATRIIHDFYCCVISKA